MYMVQRQLKYTKMGFSHSQLNPVTEMTDQKGFLNKTTIPYTTSLQKTQLGQPESNFTILVQTVIMVHTFDVPLSKPFK